MERPTSAMDELSTRRVPVNVPIQLSDHIATSMVGPPLESEQEQGVLVRNC